MQLDSKKYYKNTGSLNTRAHWSHLVKPVTLGGGKEIPNLGVQMVARGAALPGRQGRYRVDCRLLENPRNNLLDNLPFYLELQKEICLNASTEEHPADRGLCSPGQQRAALLSLAPPF